MDRSDPVTLQLPQQLLMVKSNVVCMTSRPLSHFYTSSPAPIIPEYTAQSPLHCHLPLLASVHAVPSLWNSLPHFCTWCTIALNAAPRSPPPRSPPDSPPTCFKCHPALLLCVGAMCSQARELLEGRDGSSSMILVLVTRAGQLVGAQYSLSERVN